MDNKLFKDLLSKLGLIDEMLVFAHVWVIKDEHSGLRIYSDRNHHPWMLSRKKPLDNDGLISANLISSHRHSKWEVTLPEKTLPKPFNSESRIRLTMRWFLKKESITAGEHLMDLPPAVKREFNKLTSDYLNARKKKQNKIPISREQRSSKH